MDLVVLAALGAFFSLLTAEVQGGQAIYLGVNLGFSFQDYGVVLLAGVGILFVGKTVLSALAMWAMARFVGRIETSAASRIAEFLFSGERERLRNFSDGEILWASGSSTAAAFTQRLTNFSNFVTESVMVASISLFLFFADPQLAVIVCVYFAVFAAFFSLFVNRWIAALSIRVAEGGVRSTTAMTQLLGLYRELRVVSQTDFFLGEYRSSRGKMAGASALQGFAAGIPRMGLEVALYAGAVAFLAFVVVSDRGVDALAGFMIIMIGASRIVIGLVPLQRAVSDLRSDTAVAEMSLKLLTQASEAEGNDGASLSVVRERSKTYEAVKLSFSDVGFRYPHSQNDTLSDISFEILAGQFVAFIGPSGGGKSTIVDLMLGFLTPNRGRVEIEGVSPSDFLQNHPGRIGFVPQKPGLVAGTVAANVALGNFRRDEGRFMQVLGQARLQELIYARPEGVEFDLGKQLDSLSGGQLQRLSLARALYLQPDLLVLDEATSSLDISTESEVFKNVLKPDLNRTTVVVAHRLATVVKADVVFLVDQGKIADFGTFTELKGRSPMVAEFAELSSVDGEGTSFNDERS